MKQFIVLDHFMKRKDVVDTDIVPKVYDCIVPQKTTFTFAREIKISDEDIIILRDKESRNVEFLGIIDTIERADVTKVAVLPFISICDNDLKLSVLDGTESVQTWVTKQILANFVNVDDDYNKYALHIRDNTLAPVIYKEIIDTDNLLDALNDIFLKTGIYIDFSVSFDNGVVDEIYCDICNTNEQKVKQIRYDNPQIVGKVNYNFSQYNNYTKANIYVEALDTTFSFYLREDNIVTTNPLDAKRLKKVKSKNIKYTEEYSSDQQLVEALVLLAQKTLCGDAFAYSIEFNVLRRAISDWKFRQRCNFMAENKLYPAIITNIEYVNDEEAKITLGAYRYTLTDKFKMLLRKPRDIGDSLNGINISTGLGSVPYWFTQENGNLYLNYPSGTTPPKLDVGTDNERYQFSIDEDGNLWYEYDTSLQSEPDFNVDEYSRELIYTF